MKHLLALAGALVALQPAAHAADDVYAIAMPGRYEVAPSTVAPDIMTAIVATVRSLRGEADFGKGVAPVSLAPDANVVAGDKLGDGPAFAYDGYAVAGVRLHRLEPSAYGPKGRRLMGVVQFVNAAALRAETAFLIDYTEAGKGLSIHQLQTMAVTPTDPRIVLRALPRTAGEALAKAKWADIASFMEATLALRQPLPQAEGEWLLVALSPGLNHYEYHTNAEALYTAFFLLFCYGFLVLFQPGPCDQLEAASVDETGPVFSESRVVEGNGLLRDTSGGIRCDGMMPVVLYSLLGGWLVYLKMMAVLVIAPVSAQLWRLRLKRIGLMVLAVTLVMMLGWSELLRETFGRFQFMAGGGIHQLYKTVTHVRILPTDDPKMIAFKTGLIQLEKHYPPEQKYEAVNEWFRVLLTDNKNAEPESVVYNRYNDLCLKAAWDVAVEDPGYYLWVTAQDYWTLLTDAEPWDPYRLYGLLILLPGAAGIWLSYRRFGTHHPSFLMTLIIIIHLALYPLANLMLARYRLPVEPLLGIFAVYFLSEKIARFKQDTSESNPA